MIAAGFSTRVLSYLALLPLAALSCGPCLEAWAAETTQPSSALVEVSGGSAPAAPRDARFSPDWKLNVRPVWAHIYIDASGSMKGFLGRKDQAYERLLSRIPDIAIGASAIELDVFSFGSQVSPRITDRPLQRFVTEPRVYAERNTYLPAPLEHSIAREGPGLTVVVTDGVASSARKSKNSCGLLSDTACLARRVREYAGKGYGFWIVGARLPFIGSYTVEEGGSAAKAGTRLDVSVKGRPLYLWIVTPNAPQGRRVASDLADFISKSGNEVFAVEVAPGAWERWRLPDELTARDVQNNPKREARTGAGGVCKAKCGIWKSATGDHGTDRGAIIEFPPDPPNASLSVRLPIERLTESVAAGGSLLPLLRFDQALGLEVPSGVSPNSVHLASRLSGPEGLKPSVDLCMDVASAPSVQGKAIRVLAEWGAPKPTETSPWREWSTDTDDTVAAAGRTVNLATFIEHLLRALTDQAPPVVWQEPFLTVQYLK